VTPEVFREQPETGPEPLASQRPAHGRTTVRVAWRLLRSDPRAYLIAWLHWVAFHSWPIPVGLALKLVIDRVQPGTAGISVGTALVVLAVAELTRWLVFTSAVHQFAGAWVGWLTVPRANILRSLATGPGPVAGRLPGSPGEAVSRFRDDVEDTANVVDVWLDISGAVVSTAVAVAILASIDPVTTVAVVTPVLVALVVARWLGPRLRAWRFELRAATAEVTGFLGDVLGAVQALKAAGAEEATGARFRTHNDRRARAALRDQMGTELVQSLGGLTGEIGVGLALLLVAPRLRAGELSVGDLALFTSYVVVLASLPRWAGRLGAYHRQADVSVRRLAELLPGPDADPRRVVDRNPTHLRHGPPPLPRPRRDPSDRLEALVVRDLTATHGTGGPGITGVDLEVRRGELVVVTGPVGGGKTTLLRALLGLVPARGAITWNGERLEDPAVDLGPPRTAYLPQVPRLFSESLAETVLLGWPDDGLADAIRLARLEDEVLRMPSGLATRVGPRGVRLSGGQVQRTGIARALVRAPELLVVDDLSSALDAETEAQLWVGLLDGGDLTALVVTHRPAVLARADRVLVLDGGRPVAP
jgi:ATP-binding cassette, subfamily B, bacterial